MRTILEKVEQLSSSSAAVTVTYKPTLRDEVLVIDRVYASVDLAATTDIEVGIKSGNDEYPLDSKYITRAGDCVAVQGPIYLQRDWTVYAKTSAAIEGYTLTLDIFGHVLRSE